ncbi:poly [ADP-ribose] polymerase tankyrase-1-like [Mytilus trossulus]|uniref:poly [ADP-ribose] polymerase tankyrase-1-like n=1 Tax=Mytilus trossulus TaxID=6551 RepID=UPI00300448B4
MNAVVSASKLYYAVVRENFGEVIELLGRGASVNYKYGYDNQMDNHNIAYTNVDCIMYHCYTKTIAPKIFNYKQALQDLDLEQYLNKPPTCDCSHSPYNYSPSGHVIIGDLNIIQHEHLRKRATPLHQAAVRGNVEVADLLIRNSADVNAFDQNRATPLHQAAERGNVEVADLLIRNSADVNAFDQNGDTPLHETATVEVADLLTRNSADVNAIDNNRATPLHQAAKRVNVEVADLLIRNSADVNAFDQNGFTPLHSAANRGSVEVTDLLIRNKADVNAPDNDGATPLHNAAKGGHVEVSDLLIRNKAGVNTSDNDITVKYFSSQSRVKFEHRSHMQVYRSETQLMTS